MNLLNIDNYFMIKKNIEREFNYAASIFGTINLKNGTITKIFQKYYYYSSFWLTKFFKSRNGTGRVTYVIIIQLDLKILAGRWAILNLS